MADSSETYDAQGHAGAPQATVPPPPGQPPAPPGQSPFGPNGRPPEWPRKRAGLWFGFILVFVGLAILADRFIPGVRIWQLWPLLVVAAGVRTMFTEGDEGRNRVNRAVEGITIITIGLLFLGITAGSLSWGLWLSVFSLWPLLLIAAGIDIIGKGLDSGWLRTLSSLVVLGGLLYGAFVLPSGTFNLSFGIAGPRAESFEYSEPASSRVERGQVTIEGSVGEVIVESGTDLITAEGATPFGDPEFDVATSGSSVEADVSMGGDGVWIGYRGRPRLDVTLSEDVEWDVEIDSGVSQLDADFADVDVRDLVVKTGVSDSTITLGELAAGAGRVGVRVQSGVSTVQIRIPEGAPFRVVANAGLGNITIAESGGPTIGSRTYETDDYDRSRNAYDIEVSSGVSSIDIVRY